MNKVPLITLLISGLFSFFQINCAEKYLTSVAKNTQAASALTFSDLSTILASQLMEKKGPLGNFTLRTGLSSATDSTFDENFKGFIRVDTQDKKLYNFSKINPGQPIEEGQASRFQIVFLTDYEIKLFKNRPTRADKLALATGNNPTDEESLKTAFNNAKTRFDKALGNYSDANKETLSEFDTILLINEFAKTIELVTTGLSDQTADEKIKDLAGFNNFVVLFKDKILSLITELQKLTFDQKTAQTFINAVKAWDFGYSTKINGAPKSGDIVIIKLAGDNGKYVTTTKSKDSSGADIFYISSTANDLFSATQFKVQELGGRLGFTSISGESKDLIIKATPSTVDTGIVESSRKKQTRIILSQKQNTSFGQAGSEDQQFQLTGNSDGIFLECMAQKDSVNGYLTSEATDSSFLRVYDSSGNPLAKNDINSKFKLIIISNNKAFFDGLFESRSKTDPTQKLESFSNLVDLALTSENGQLLLDEITQFLLDNKKTSNDWTTFKRNFGLLVGALKDKFAAIFGDTFLTNSSYTKFKDTLESEFSSTTAGLPANGDVVVIYSPTEQKYLSVTKTKLPSGEEVFYLTSSSDDPISASQFKVQTTQDGLNFGFESLSSDSAGLIIQALPPVIQADSVQSTRKQLTRIMLSQKPKQLFGQAGTEHGQFNLQQVNANNLADGFYLRSVGQKDTTKGFLTIDKVNDDTFLRAFDNMAQPLPQSSNSIFKLTIISKSKTFFDALSKIRTETNPATRLDLYATMIASAGSTENGILLLDEIKRFVLENKKTANGWTDFKGNFEAKINEIITTFNDTFSKEINDSSSLQNSRDALVQALTSIFVEKLTSGTYAIAWINQAGENKFLKLISEDQGKLDTDYTQQFKVCALGVDQLDPASIFNVKVSDTESVIQLETDYNKEAVLSGPNKKIEGDTNAASYSTTKVADKSSDSAFKYLRIVGWRQYSNKATTPSEEPQAPFEFSFEGSLDNMKLKSRSNSGYWTVDPTTLCIKTTGDDGNALTSPSENSNFALILIPTEAVELAKIRGKNVIDQIAFYISKAKQITPKTTNTLREQLISEIEKSMNLILSSPDKYRDAKANSTKIDELVKLITDQKTVSTYKTVSDRTDKIKQAWAGGFVGPVENDKSHVFSLSDPTLGNKIFKLEKSSGKDEYVLKTVDKKDKSDELEPLSRFKATVGNDNIVIFTTSLDGKIYTLSTIDDPVQKLRSGIVAKIVTTPTESEKFLASTNSDMTVSFKSLKTNGFLTVDSAGLLSTLSELTSEKAGIIDQNQELIPTEQAKFKKTVLTVFHENLSEDRKITDDQSRLSKYIEKSIYKDVTADQIEALASEVILWTKKIIEETGQARYKTLSANKAFSDKLNTLFTNILNKLPSDSQFKKFLPEAQTRWTGGTLNLLRNPIIPEDGKKMLLRFTPSKSGAGKVYLKAVKDDTSGNVILKAESTLSVDPANILQVMIDGNKVGFKSPSNQDMVLFSKSLPAESSDWAPKKKIIESALTFMPADQTKFRDKTPSGCQFIVADGSTAENASFQLVGYDNDDPTKRVKQGFMSFSGDITGTIRILNDSTLEPIVADKDHLTANERFSIIITNDIYDKLLAILTETDNEKVSSALKAIVPQIKPNTIDKVFFIDALAKAFKDKRDAKISGYINEIIKKVEEEWSLTETSDDVLKIKAILSTTVLVGDNYVNFVKESLKTLLATDTAQRQAYIEGTLASQFKDWQISLDSSWSDEIIKADLKLTETGTTLTKKILLARIKTFNDFLDVINKFVPFDKTNKTGIKEIKAAFVAKLNSLKLQGASLAAAATTTTTSTTTSSQSTTKLYK